jgi:16S rRNA C967 or C1407 C5-methylase (RsmB/RsmF family)
MSTKTKTFDAIKADVRTRMDELAGAAAEHSELKRFWDTVEAAQAITPTRPTQARRTARVTPGAAKIAKRASVKRGRPQGSGKRAQEAIHLLSMKPGQTTAELASAMGIKSNYLYRVLPDMAAKGVLVKDDGGRFSVA